MQRSQSSCDDGVGAGSVALIAGLKLAQALEGSDPPDRKASADLCSLMNSMLRISEWEGEHR